MPAAVRSHTARSRLLGLAYAGVAALALAAAAVGGLAWSRVHHHAAPLAGGAPRRGLGRAPRDADAFAASATAGVHDPDGVLARVARLVLTEGVARAGPDVCSGGPPEEDTAHAEAIESAWRAGEAATRDDAPGRSWAAEEKGCARQRPCPGTARKQWAEAHLADALGRPGAPSGTEVAEIGPCLMPVRPELPGGRRAQYEYLDATQDQTILGTYCFNWNNETIDISIVTEAQTMSGVASERFTVLMAFHVLEHMPDVFKGLESWLRTVAMGGVLLFAIPSGCHGSEFDRLLTSPAHFGSEYGRSPANDALTAPHRAEGLVGVFTAGGIVERIKELDRMGTVNSAAHVATCEHSIFGRADGDEVSRRARAALLRKSWAKLMHAPRHAHLHVWTAESLRATLNELRRYARGVCFEVLEVNAYAATFFTANELRAAVRRVPCAEAPAAPAGLGASLANARHEQDAQRCLMPP